MATHSSTLAWRIPWMEEPGGLPSMGSHSRTRLKQLSSSSMYHMDMSLGKPGETVKAREAGGAAVHGVAKSQV